MPRIQLYPGPDGTLETAPEHSAYLFYVGGLGHNPFRFLLTSWEASANTVLWFIEKGWIVTVVAVPLEPTEEHLNELIRLSFRKALHVYGDAAIDSALEAIGSEGST